MENKLESRDLSKIDYHLSEDIIKSMYLYTLTISPYITKNCIINMDKLMSSYDYPYNMPVELSLLVEKIKSGISARVRYNLNSSDMILKYMYSNINDKDVPDLSTLRVLDIHEIQSINDIVCHMIKQNYMYNEMNRLNTICREFTDTNELNKREELCNTLENEINDAQNMIRKMSVSNKEDDSFSINNIEDKNSFSEIYDKLNAPSRKLIVGNQALNELLGGGFENGRVYTFLGLPGEGKSLTLLNLAIMIKRYNKHYKTKDSTKRPCIVILTMENTILETVDRLYNLSTRDKKHLCDYTQEDARQNFINAGITTSQDNPINIEVVFKPPESVTTAYLYELCNELEDKGEECICVIQDYISKIKPTQKYNDIRVEYGLVVDEFKTFATYKDIPVITASQLNREAAKSVDDNRRHNYNNLVQLLGRNNISESILILNNSDAAYIITPEYDNDNVRWVGFNRVKKRFDATNRDCFYIPCYPGTNVLVEDINNEFSAKTMMTDTKVNANLNHTLEFVNFKASNDEKLTIESLTCDDDDDRHSDMPPFETLTKTASYDKDGNDIFVYCPIEEVCIKRERKYYNPIIQY